MSSQTTQRVNADKAAYIASHITTQMKANVRNRFRQSWCKQDGTQDNIQGLSLGEAQSYSLGGTRGDRVAHRDTYGAVHGVVLGQCTGYCTA